MWNLNFLVKFALKFGVLLAVPRNEAIKNPRNPTICLILIEAFDAKKIVEKKECTVQFC